MFIRTEDTPNPDVMKFLPGCVVATGAAYEYTSAQDAQDCGLAASLFDIDGVRTVFFASDYLSVGRALETDWSLLKPQILAAIADRIALGAPLAKARADAGAPDNTETRYEGETAEIVAEIKNLLDTRVRPAVAGDGGDIVFRSFDADTGVVSVYMRGACSGCPSSTITLKSGIENLLRHYVPEVTAVHAAE